MAYGERSKQWDNLAQRLENYKETHKERAKAAGRLEAFMRARTLTEARKILRGEATR